MAQGKAVWQEEPPCIWALAGVLSSRPCDRHYECERCPLFHALRDGPGGPELPTVDEAAPAAAHAVEHQVNAYLARLLAGCTLRLDRAYTSGHWWVDASNPPQVTLGLEAHVLRMLQPVDDVVTPRDGVWLRRPDPCGWILRGRVSVPLHAPVSGEVEKVNAHYLAAVKAPGTFADGDDWLLRLTPHEDVEAVPGLYRGAEALVWQSKKLQLLKSALREALAAQAGHTVGATLADGGEPTLDLEVVLGRARFEAIVDRLFRIQSS